MKPPKEESCTCGSGKPQSHCCGRGKVADFEAYKWQRVTRDLQSRLLQFAEEERFLPDSEAAFQLYLDLVAGEMFDSDEEPVLISFVDWFVYDYPLTTAGGKTLLQLFLEEKAAELGPIETELLHYWQRAVISLLRVKEASWGQVVLEDLVVGGEYPLQEVPGPHGVVPGTLVLGRLIRVGKAYAFAGSALEFTPLLRDEILHIVERLFHSWKRNTAYNSREEFLKEEGFRLPALIGSALEQDDLAPSQLPGEQEDDLEQRQASARHLAISRLEEFYCRWLNLPLPALQGRTPWEASREPSQKYKVARLVDELEALGESPGDNARKNCEATHFDFDRVRQVLGVKSWHREVSGFQEVQSLLLDGEGGRDFRALALRIWHDFYAMVQPRVQKPGAWVGALEYVVGLLTGNRVVTQQQVASEYQVSVSAVARNSAQIWDTLELEELDRRYALNP